MEGTDDEPVSVLVFVVAGVGGVILKGVQAVQYHLWHNPHMVGGCCAEKATKHLPQVFDSSDEPKSTTEKSEDNGGQGGQGRSVKQRTG